MIQNTKKIKYSKRFLSFILSFLLVILSLNVPSLPVSAATTKPQGWVTPFEKYGELQLAIHDGVNQLSDEAGDPVTLKGMSSFGLQWDDGNWVLTEDAFDVLAYDWKCDIVRLAMYVAEGGYSVNPAAGLARVEQGIELATERGMYVMVDWHMLSPGDPEDDVYLEAGLGDDLESMPDRFQEIANADPNLDGPQVFFAYLAERYGDQGNVLWEVANEPNGNGTQANAAEAWSTELLPYMQRQVDNIREYDDDSIIICGTDNWSQFVDAPIDSPVVDSANKVMYAVHFYAGTHDAGYEYDDGTGGDEPGDPAPLGTTGQYWLRKMIDNALAGGLAVFCTEWGTSLATGDGGPYIDFAERWLEYLENNGISWCSWSLAQKDEISAACKATTPATIQDGINVDDDGIPYWSQDQLSVSGWFVRGRIRDGETPMIEKELIIEEFTDGIGGAEINEGSPNKTMTFTSTVINGSVPVLEVSNVSNGGIWDNRIGFAGQSAPYGLYQNFIFDLYIPKPNPLPAAEAIVASFKPILQDAVREEFWIDGLPETALTGSDFVEDGDYIKTRVTIPLQALNPQPDHGMTAFILLSDLQIPGDMYIGRVGLFTSYNGDIKYEPKVPDKPGTFIKLPFEFEADQREGWTVEGASKLDYENISIEKAETNAFSFPFDFSDKGIEWEDGARVSSSTGGMGLSAPAFSQLGYVKFDVYLEAEEWTTGNLALEVCPIPAGDGYWYQAPGGFTMTKAGGKKITNEDDKELLKYVVYVPVGDYAASGINNSTKVRNLVLALHSTGTGSDFKGRVYYDNIGFLGNDDVITNLVDAYKEAFAVDTDELTNAEEIEAFLEALSAVEDLLAEALADIEYSPDVTEVEELLDNLAAAKEAATTVEVSFAANGGTGTKDTVKVDLGNYTLPDNNNAFSRDGYRFAGWKVNNAGNVLAAGASYTLTDDIILYAQWVKQVDVSFDANGGVGQKDKEAKDEGSTYTLPANPFTRDGYGFIGWKVNDAGDVLAAGESYTLTENITLYAQWVLDQVQATVSFNANGATGQKAAEVKSQGAYTLPGNPFTYNGYTFLGWKVNNTGTVLKAGESYNLTGNIVLWAQWQINTYTISYKNGSKNASMPKNAKTTFNVTESFNLPAPNAVKGSVFGGWYKETNFKTKVSAVAKGTFSNQTFYAKYVKNNSVISGKKNVKIKKKITLTAKSANKAAVKKITWKSNNKNVKIKVTKNKATITGVKAGKSKITATITFKDGSKAKSKTYTVTVKK